jgi:hypothetical protein
MMFFGKCLLAVSFLLFAASVTGCAGIASPAVGSIWMDVHGPIQAGGKVGAKEGRACAQSILGVFATGDASIKAAAAAGGITKIDSVDHHSIYKVVMGEYCTIVRGS